jgi:hypothetical protein
MMQNTRGSWLAKVTATVRVLKLAAVPTSYKQRVHFVMNQRLLIICSTKPKLTNIILF